MTRPATLSSCTWPELENSATTLLVAVGSLEQHGPHLPLDTDTRIASAVVARVHANLDDPSTLIAPPLGYGAFGPATPERAALPVPSRVYFDLTTWHLINTVYQPARVAELRAMADFYGQPEHHRRLTELTRPAQSVP